MSSWLQIVTLRDFAENPSDLLPRGQSPIQLQSIVLGKIVPSMEHLEYLYVYRNIHIIWNISTIMVSIMEYLIPVQLGNIWNIYIDIYIYISILPRWAVFKTLRSLIYTWIIYRTPRNECYNLKYVRLVTPLNDHQPSFLSYLFFSSIGIPSIPIFWWSKHVRCKPTFARIESRTSLDMLKSMRRVKFFLLCKA